MLGIDVVSERLIVVAKGATAANDLVPFVRSYQRDPRGDRFLNAPAALQQRRDVGLKRAGYARQRRDRWYLLSGFDLGQITFRKPDLFRQNIQREAFCLADVTQPAADRVFDRINRSGVVLRRGVRADA